tara:strand:+ start:488 stop:745 length:258 start_codon:yes stop_codon:yes gene_type:complete
MNNSDIKKLLGLIAWKKERIDKVEEQIALLNDNKEALLDDIETYYLDIGTYILGEYDEDVSYWTSEKKESMVVLIQSELNSLGLE